MPKVSVCIPTFNRSALLPYAVTSVLQQTYTDFEVIVCDDGSTDNTAQVMAYFTDARVRYIRHAQNIGKSNNMRSGFAAATGEYFIKFDDDDRLTPNFLAETMNVLIDHPDIDFVGTDHWIIDQHNQRDLKATEFNSQKWGRKGLTAGMVPDLLEVVFVRQSFQVGATLFRRQALVEVDFMRPNLQNCEDNDLFVRLALAGKQGYYLDDRLMEYRVHAEQQGLHRAVPYLKDKLLYLNSYQFASKKLEQIRQARLRETQLLLGLRLIHLGETQTGRQLVLSGQSASLLKAWVGLGVSLLPLALRKQVFHQLQQ